MNPFCSLQGFASGDSEVDAYSIRKFVADGNLIMLGQSYAKVGAAMTALVMTVLNLSYFSFARLALF